jgi:hypothetical protein
MAGAFLLKILFITRHPRSRDHKRSADSGACAVNCALTRSTDWITKSHEGTPMFHDKRIHGSKADPKRVRRQLMLRGVGKISLWQHLPKPELGSAADDWKATGDDLRSAMSEFATPCD